MALLSPALSRLGPAVLRMTSVEHAWGESRSSSRCAAPLREPCPLAAAPQGPSAGTDFKDSQFSPPLSFFPTV